MTERGLPLADGAPACPFVAFEDDRDERQGDRKVDEGDTERGERDHEPWEVHLGDQVRVADETAAAAPPTVTAPAGETLRQEGEREEIARSDAREVEPSLADEHVEDHVIVPSGFADYRRHFALRVRGTSMIDAGILDGDLVVIRESPVADDGDIVAVLLPGAGEDEATVKRLLVDEWQPEGDYGPGPLAKVRELVAEKYGRDEWNRRSGQTLTRNRIWQICKAAEQKLAKALAEQLRHQ